jgi:hypothetical protein
VWDATADARTGARTGEATDPDTDRLRDWITIVQSELAALAADRELSETMQRMVAAWAQAAQAMVSARRGTARERPAGPARTDAAARPAAAAAASDARDAEIARLFGRVAELESRLAALERQAGERASGKHLP